MESQPTSPTLEFVSSAWPTRLTGVIIFLVLLFAFFSHAIPLFVVGIACIFMLLAVLFSADTSVTADNSQRTLVVIKKRILASSTVVHPYDDIMFLCQNITTAVSDKGEKTERNSYSLALNSKPSASGYRGRMQISIPIPTSSVTMFSQTGRSMQEFARAQELANFIGVPLYVNGGSNDSIVNLMVDVPGYIQAIPKISDALADAKEANEKAAREILGDKYPEQH